MKKEGKHKGKIIRIKCGYHVPGLTMKEYNELKKYFEDRHKIETADLCEIAHAITEEICKAKGIALNKREI
jgi:hypothetical protein